MGGPTFSIYSDSWKLIFAGIRRALKNGARGCHERLALRPPDVFLCCAMSSTHDQSDVRRESGSKRGEIRRGEVAAARPPVRSQRPEIARIVRRLEAIITNHLEGARRVQHPLALEQVVTIIDALRAEARGETRPVAFSNSEVTFYLMDGLYEELLGEPSNIFYAPPVTEGVTRFEPLQRDFWLACLEALRHRLERLGLSAP